MNTKRTLLLLALILILVGCNREAGGVVLERAATAAADADTPPTPRPARPLPEGVTILADGQLVAVNPVLSLSFTGNGRLLELRVKPGDVVAEGDLIATLDDESLRDAVTSAELQVAQAGNSLAQAQLSLDNLLNWVPDETAVALAKANLAAAEAGLEDAQTQDGFAGNSLTSARISVNQAERALTDAQNAYNTAFDPGRDWELGDPFRKTMLENEREATTRGLQQAQEALEVTRAQYNLALAGLNDNSAVNAQANVVSAQQALQQAQTGPKEPEIAAARLQVEQAELSLQQSQFSLEQARNALENAQLTAPWPGAILSVDATPGAIVGAGAPIVTLLDTDNIQFHTTNLSERDLAQIEPGQPAQITLKSYPNQPVAGVVARIGLQASGMVGDAAVFTVIIDLADTADLDLRPGMTGRTEITNE